MPQPRLYDDPTVLFTFRMSEPSRRLLDLLAAREGMRSGPYLRRVWEEHLEAQGFELTRGEDAVLDPERGTPDGWVRDHTTGEDP